MRAKSLHRSLLHLQQRRAALPAEAGAAARRRAREHRGVSAFLRSLSNSASTSASTEAAAAAEAIEAAAGDSTTAATAATAATAPTAAGLGANAARSGSGAKLGCAPSFSVAPIFLQVPSSRLGARRSRLTLLLERWVPKSSKLSSSSANGPGSSSSSSSRSSAVGVEGGGSSSSSSGRWLNEPMATLEQQERARDELSAHFPRCTQRLPALQALTLVSATLRSGSDTTLLSNIAQHYQKARIAKTLAARPESTLQLLEEMRSLPGWAGNAEVLGFLATVAKQLSTHIETYGPAALPVLTSLARLGGGRIFRKLPEDEVRELVRRSAMQAGILASAAEVVEGRERARRAISDNTIFVPEEADTDAVAELFWANGKMGTRDAVLTNAMSRHLSGHSDGLSTSRISSLTQALAVGGRNIPSLDFILLHSLVRLASSRSEEIDGPTAVSILQAVGRAELFDEECLATISSALEKDAMSLSTEQLADAMYGFGNLQVRELGCLDPLCDALRSRIDEVGEADLVRFVRGMSKIRHKNEELLAGLAPAIDRMKDTLHNNSLTNLTNCLASFQTSTISFLPSLLDASSSRIDRLGSMSLQHLLLSLCRLRSLPREQKAGYLEKICAHIPGPRMRTQITPVQANTSLIALSRLQWRDLPSVAALVNNLMCRGTNPVWSFAPSPNFYRGDRPWQDIGPFDEARIFRLWKQEFDNTHCVDALQALHQLDVVGTLTMRMSAMTCRRLLPDLHECRAREVLCIARALSDWRMPGPPPQVIEDLSTAATSSKKGQPGQQQQQQQQQETGTAASAGKEEEDEEEEDEGDLGEEEDDGRPRSAGELSWREKLLEHCLENLRRHEHWLESNWSGLTPLKLLCMEVDSGIYGTRRLDEFLRSSVFEFVHRLRCLSAEEVEANRISRERTEEEEEEGPGEAKLEEKEGDEAKQETPMEKGQEEAISAERPAAAATVAEAAEAAEAAPTSELPDFARIKLESESNWTFGNTRIGDFPVDVVVLPREAIPQGMDLDDPLSFDFANLSRGSRPAAAATTPSP